MKATIIQDTFKKVYNNCKNMMTPNLLDYGKANNYLYELSYGYGFNYNKIYGVTVLKLVADEATKTELNGCYHSKAEALAAINALSELD